MFQYVSDPSPDRDRFHFWISLDGRNFTACSVKLSDETLATWQPGHQLRGAERYGLAKLRLQSRLDHLEPRELGEPFTIVMTPDDCEEFARTLQLFEDSVAV